MPCTHWIQFLHATGVAQNSSKSTGNGRSACHHDQPKTRMDTSAEARGSRTNEDSLRRKKALAGAGGGTGSPSRNSCDSRHRQPWVGKKVTQPPALSRPSTVHDTRPGWCSSQSKPDSPASRHYSTGTIITTRRFSWRPASVRLSATGLVIPRPRTSRLPLGIPISVNTCATACARFIESRWL